MHNFIQTKPIEEDVKTAGHILHLCHVQFSIRICVLTQRCQVTEISFGKIDTSFFSETCS